MASPIKLGAAFFCEDIRTEDTGKFIFLGTYTGSMISTVNPANTYVNLVVIVRANSPAEGRFQLKVSMGDRVLAEADAQVQVDDTGHAFMIFPPLFIEDVTETMPILVDAKIDDDDWERIYKAPYIVPDQDGGTDATPMN